MKSVGDCRNSSVYLVPIALSWITVLSLLCVVETVAAQEVVERKSIVQRWDFGTVPLLGEIYLTYRFDIEARVDSPPAVTEGGANGSIRIAIKVNKIELIDSKNSGFVLGRSQCVFIGDSRTGEKPYFSEIFLENEVDRFRGTASVAGNDGYGPINVEVSLGGIGFSYGGETWGLELNGPRLYLVNNLFGFQAFDNIKGCLYQGGSVTLSIDSIALQGDSNSGEIGSLRIYMPINVALVYFTSPVTIAFSPKFPPSAFSLSQRYVRGKFVPLPEFTLNASNYTLTVGRKDTLIATLTNQSQAVALKGGKVSVKPESLGPLILESSDLNVDTVLPESSRDYSFVVAAVSLGESTPQAVVTNLGWDPPIRNTIDDIATIDATITVTESVGSDEQVDSNTDFSLSQNYPNPVYLSTSFAFTIPRSTMVKIVIFDVLGREVARVLEGTKPAGRHELSVDASRLASGVYFYRLDAGGRVATKSMYVVK